jgi:hypothetical protein
MIAGFERRLYAVGRRPGVLSQLRHHAGKYV